MSQTSKSPKAVIFYALLAAEKAFPAFRHKNSPKKFTQHQLFACLVLKSFLRTDYRGVVAQLSDCSDLREAIGLEVVPHFTTIQKAAQRLLLSTHVRRLLDRTIQLKMRRRRRVRVAAMDSTGLSTTAASAYFVKRRSAVESRWKTVTYHRYPLVCLVADASTHFVLAVTAGEGPRLDVQQFPDLLQQASRRVTIQVILADAGFDSEANHTFARHGLRIRSVILPKRGRPGLKPAAGHYRRLMQTRFDTTLYRRRGQIETVISMIKRRLGSHLRGQTYHSRRRELCLLAITHNLMILWRVTLFY